MGSGNLTDSLEDKARNALVEELQRQAADRPDLLTVLIDGDMLHVNGQIDADAVVMAVIGSAMGGP